MSAVNFLLSLCSNLLALAQKKTICTSWCLICSVRYNYCNVFTMNTTFVKKFQQNCISGAILLKDFLQHVRIQYELSSNFIIYDIEGTESWPSSEFLLSSSPCTCRNKGYHWKHYGTICTIRYVCVQKLVKKLRLRQFDERKTNRLGSPVSQLVAGLEPWRTITEYSSFW